MIVTPGRLVTWLLSLALAAVAAVWLSRSSRISNLGNTIANALSVESIADIPYGEYPETRLDILRPRWGRKATLSPGVVVFHGGGWIEGSREFALQRECTRYLKKGFVVANVGYRRGLFRATQDARAALSWFLVNASRYGVDTARIVVTGESAGGHLALYAAFSSTHRVAAVVSVSAISDLVLISNTRLVRDALTGADDRAELTAISPLLMVRPGLAPVLAVHGMADTLVPVAQTEILARRLRDSGCDAQSLLIPNGAHGLTPEQYEVVYQAVFKFLRSRGVL